MNVIINNVDSKHSVVMHITDMNSFLAGTVTTMFVKLPRLKVRLARLCWEAALREARASSHHYTLGIATDFATAQHGQTKALLFSSRITPAAGLLDKGDETRLPRSRFMTDPTPLRSRYLRCSQIWIWSRRST